MSDRELIDAAKAVTQAYNDKDWDAVRDAMGHGFEYDEVGTQRKIEGPDDTIAALQQWAVAFPDSRASFDKAVVSGDRVVFEVTWRGTHTGPLQTPKGEIPATGKPISMRACQVVQLHDGKIVSMQHYFDMVTLLRQIGVE